MSTSTAAARAPHAPADHPPAALAAAPEIPAQARRGVNRRLPRRPMDDQEFLWRIQRMIRQYGGRAGRADASVLKDLLELRDLIDSEAAAAARALHDGTPGRPPLSWGVIGSELGITKQAAYQKWGKTDDRP